MKKRILGLVILTILVGVFALRVNQRESEVNDLAAVECQLPYTAVNGTCVQYIPPPTPEATRDLIPAGMDAINMAIQVNEAVGAPILCPKSQFVIPVGCPTLEPWPTPQGGSDQ